MPSVLCVAVVGLGCLACGTPPPAAKPTDQGSAASVAVDAAVVIADAPTLDRDYPRLAERSVKLYQEVVETFRAAGEDCGAAATRLAELQKTYADVTAANLEVLRNGRAKELKAALVPYDAQFDQAAQAIMSSPTLSKCSQHGPFARAFDELVGSPP